VLPLQHAPPFQPNRGLGGEKRKIPALGLLHDGVAYIYQRSLGEKEDFEKRGDLGASPSIVLT
jgi:hypothetical protein